MNLTTISKQRRLKGVTLWSCAHNDAEYLSRTVRVLKFCELHFQFDEVLLLTHLAPPPVPIHWRIQRIPSLTIDQWNQFHIRSVASLIGTGFAMSVHEDGFPILPELWSDEFLGYDYIGAPWPDGRVGNGGFCIESRNVMQEKSKVPAPANLKYPSDLFVCKLYCENLKRKGIRFAPTELALRFSTEILGNSKPSLGFHGRRDCPLKYKAGWKMIAAVSEPPPPTRQEKPDCVLVYIYVPNSERHRMEAETFVASYLKFPPNYPHRTMIVCNGAQPGTVARDLFSQLPKVEFLPRVNAGWDIGGFVTAAKRVKTDMLFCLGSGAFFRRSGWLLRIAEAWEKHGPGFYGTNAAFDVLPHINTTGFGCPPKVLATYPFGFVTLQERYHFEHGRTACWKHAEQLGLPVKLVTWNGEYDWQEWRSQPNIYHRGDQSNCLTYWDRNTIYESSSQQQKREYEAMSDTIQDCNYRTKLPKILMVYIYPVNGGDANATRFVNSYICCPPGMSHETVVVCNGGHPTEFLKDCFRDITCSFVVHDNTGWDIGAYQFVARTLKAEAMICMGGPSTVKRHDWIALLGKAWMKNGRGLYGTVGSFQYGVKHIATSGFLCPATLIRQYPVKVESYDERSEFEHGKSCLTNLAIKLGMKVKMVTSDGVWGLEEMRKPRNVLNKGDQSNLLTGYTQTDIYNAATEEQRLALKLRVDGLSE